MAGTLKGDILKENIHIMAPELIKLEDDIKTWVREFGTSLQIAISAEIVGLKDLMELHMSTNEKEHVAITTDVHHFREVGKDLYEKMRVLANEMDQKVTAIRLDLEKKIGTVDDRLEEVKNAPAKRAQELMRAIGKYVLLAIVGSAITALIFWMKSVAPN